MGNSNQNALGERPEGSNSNSLIANVFQTPSPVKGQKRHLSTSADCSNVYLKALQNAQRVPVPSNRYQSTELQRSFIKTVHDLCKNEYGSKHHERTPGSTDSTPKGERQSQTSSNAMLRLDSDRLVKKLLETAQTLDNPRFSELFSGYVGHLKLFSCLNKYLVSDNVGLQMISLRLIKLMLLPFKVEDEGKLFHGSESKIWMAANYLPERLSEWLQNKRNLESNEDHLEKSWRNSVNMYLDLRCDWPTTLVPLCTKKNEAQILAMECLALFISQRDEARIGLYKNGVLESLFTANTYTNIDEQVKLAAAAILFKASQDERNQHVIVNSKILGILFTSFLTCEDSNFGGDDLRFQTQMVSLSIVRLLIQSVPQLCIPELKQVKGVESLLEVGNCLSHMISKRERKPGHSTSSQMESGLSEVFYILSNLLHDEGLKEKMNGYVPVSESRTVDNSDDSDVEEKGEKCFETKNSVKIDHPIKSGENIALLQKGTSWVIDFCFWCIQHLQNEQIRHHASVLLLDLISKSPGTEKKQNSMLFLDEKRYTGLQSILYLANTIFEQRFSKSLNFQQGHSLSIINERSRHQERYLARLANISRLVSSLAVEISVGYDGIRDDDLAWRMMNKSILPYISCILSGNYLTSSPYVDRLRYKQALVALCWLTLNARLADRIVQNHFNFLSVILEKSAHSVNEVMELGRIDKDVTFSTDDDFELADACILLHLEVRFLSNVIMHPHALTTIISRDAKISKSILSFFTEVLQNKGLDIPLPDSAFDQEDFLPLRSRSRDSGESDLEDVNDDVYCTGFNSAVVVAKIEAELGKCILEVSQINYASVHGRNRCRYRTSYELFSDGLLGTPNPHKTPKVYASSNKTKVLAWINQVSNVMVNCTDDHIKAKAAHAVWNIFDAFGWTRIFKDMAKRKNSQACRQPLGNLSENPVFKNICSFLKSDGPMGAALTSKIEACEVLYQLLEVSGDNAIENALIAQFKFDNKYSINCESVGFKHKSMGRYTGSGTCVWMSLGNPQRFCEIQPQSSRGVNQALRVRKLEKRKVLGNINMRCQYSPAVGVYRRKRSTWGVSFSGQSSLCVDQNFENSVSGVQIGESWTVSVWINYMPDMERDEKRGCRSGTEIPQVVHEENKSTETQTGQKRFSTSPHVYTLLEMNNGCQPVAFSKHPNGYLELGCVRMDSSGVSNTIWSGSEFYLQEVMPGWHHLVVVCENDQVTFHIDQSKVGKPIKLEMANDQQKEKPRSFSTVGNSAFSNYSSPLGSNCFVANLRIFNVKLPNSIVYGSPASVPFNRRPWDESEKYSAAFECVRTRIGEDPKIIERLGKLLLSDALSLRKIITCILYNLSLCNNNADLIKRDQYCRQALLDCLKMKAPYRAEKHTRAMEKDNYSISKQVKSDIAYHSRLILGHLNRKL